MPARSLAQPVPVTIWRSLVIFNSSSSHRVLVTLQLVGKELPKARETLRSLERLDSQFGLTIGRMDEVVGCI